MAASHNNSEVREGDGTTRLAAGVVLFIVAMIITLVTAIALPDPTETRLHLSCPSVVEESRLTVLRGSADEEEAQVATQVMRALMGMTLRQRNGVEAKGKRC